MSESRLPGWSAELVAEGPKPAAGVRPGSGTRRRRLALIATLLVVVALAALNFAEHFLPGDGLWLAPTAAVVLLGFARLSGLSWHQLGLSRGRIRSGLLWGGGAVAAVALIYLAGVLIPISRPAFLDARYHLGLSGALMSAFVIIPVGTVLMEEVAFRGVLWGMLSRHMTAWRVLLTSSVMFGLWHVLPSLHLGSANRGVSEAMGGGGSTASLIVVIATVAFTALGGVVAGELRRRSGSILASAGMHWATNALGVLFGLVAWKLAA